MPDLICPLFEIPDYSSLLERLAEKDIQIRTPRPWDREQLSIFIRERFGEGWVSETLIGLSRAPISIVIAVKDKKIIGFAAYDVSAPGFFGPTGVDESFRGQGVGKALFYEALKGLKDLGYVYGIIGSPGPAEFYTKAMKGIFVPDDWKNIYTDVMGLTALEYKEE